MRAGLQLELRQTVRDLTSTTRRPKLTDIAAELHRAIKKVKHQLEVDAELETTLNRRPFIKRKSWWGPGLKDLLTQVKDLGRQVKDIAAIFTARETIIKNAKKRSKLFVIAVDAKKAFDRMVRPALFAKLIGKIHPAVWRGLFRYYSDAKAAIEVDGRRSNPFSTNVGVKQGGPLSPRLFAAYLEELAEELKAANILCSIGDVTTGVILYADDILVIVNSAKRAQQALDTCTRYGRKWDIAFNPSKSECLTIGTNDQTPLYLDGRPVGRPEKLKYLGVWINRRLTNGEHLADRRLKSLRSFYGLTEVGMRSRQLNYQIETALYQACCKPTIAYRNENLALTNTDLLKAQRAEGIVVKTMLAIPKYASTSRLLDALRIEPVSEFIQRSKLALYERLNNNAFTKRVIHAALADKEKSKWHAKSLIHEVKMAVADIPHVPNHQEHEADALVTKVKLRNKQTLTTLAARYESTASTTIRAALGKPTRSDQDLFDLLQVPTFARRKRQP